MASGRSSGAVRPLPCPGGPGGPVGTQTRLEVLRRLESGPRGLVEAEAQERLARYGENAVLPAVPAGWPARLLRTPRDPFTAVLLSLGVVCAAAGAYGTACVIGVLVAVAGAISEGGIDIMPEVLVTGGGGSFEGLAATLMQVLRSGGLGAAPASTPAT